jgi:hypothetical protein
MDDVLSVLLQVSEPAEPEPRPDPFPAPITPTPNDHP